jgi:hypothetical protein
LFIKPERDPGESIVGVGESEVIIVESNLRLSNVVEGGFEKNEGGRAVAVVGIGDAAGEKVDGIGRFAKPEMGGV